MGTIFFWLVMAVIGVSSASYIVESLPQYHQYPGSCSVCAPLSQADRQDSELVSARAELGDFCKNCDPGSLIVFDTIEIVSISFFTFDYLIRLLSSWAMPTPHEIELMNHGHRISIVSFAQLHVRVSSFVWDPLNIIDLVTIAPFWLHLIAPGIPNTTAIRAIRLARVFRIMKLSELTAGASVFFRVFQKSVWGIVTLFVLTMLAVVVLGTGVYLCERGHWDPATGMFFRKPLFYLDAKIPSPFSSISQSFWYIVVTFTTVGYGDMAPTTTCGQLIGTVSMYFGVLMIAMPITLISSNFALLYDEVKAKIEKQKVLDLQRGDALFRLVCFNDVYPKKSLFRRWKAYVHKLQQEESDIDRIVRRALSECGLIHTQRPTHPDLEPNVTSPPDLTGLRDEILLEVQLTNEMMKTEMAALYELVATLQAADPADPATGTVGGRARHSFLRRKSSSDVNKK